METFKMLEVALWSSQWVKHKYLSGVPSSKAALPLLKMPNAQDFH
jgi:hypothetical protein